MKFCKTFGDGNDQVAAMLRRCSDDPATLEIRLLTKPPGAEHDLIEICIRRHDGSVDHTEEAFAAMTEEQARAHLAPAVAMLTGMRAHVRAARGLPADDESPPEDD